MESQQEWESVDGRREDEATRHSTRHVTDRETVSRHRRSLSRPTAMPLHAGSVRCHLSKACLHPQVDIPVCLPLLTMLSPRFLPGSETKDAWRAGLHAAPQYRHMCAARLRFPCRRAAALVSSYSMQACRHGERVLGSRLLRPKLRLCPLPDTSLARAQPRVAKSYT